MESARDIVDKIRELECGWLYELPHDEAAALIEARDAAIRKECADRAVEAIGNIPPSKRAIWDVVETAIRAAIMGDRNTPS